MYNVKSKKAEEFIDNQEVLDTLAYAEENKNNETLINDIITRAGDFKGLSHREAAVLLDCELEDQNKRLVTLA